MKTWWRAVVSYPPSWIAVGVVVLAVVGVIVLLEPPTLLAIAVVVVGAIAIVMWPLNALGHWHAAPAAVRDA